MELPDYETAQRRVLGYEPSALDWFVSENEPSEMVEKAKWRREVKDVLWEVEFAAEADHDETKDAMWRFEQKWEAANDKDFAAIRLISLLGGIIAGFVAAGVVWGLGYFFWRALS